MWRLSSSLHTMFRVSGFLRSHGFRYSTLSPVHLISGDRNAPIVDYLIDSLRFSKKDAVSIFSKGNLIHLKSTVNSDLILNLFKNYGLNLSQIREIVSYAPKILTCKANITLEPKIRVFQELGLSGSDLVGLIKRNPEIFGYGLHTRIIPGLDLLKRIMGSDENVIEVINKSRWLYCTNTSMKRLSTNALLLQNFGLSNERLLKFILSNPEKLMVNPTILKSKLKYVEEKMGISRNLPRFIHALSMVIYCTELEIEKKMDVFRSFGWSDSDIALLFRSQPSCLNKSNGNIHEKLEFLMKNLGYTPSYLISCNTFFTFSLEKRVIPRNTMLKMLKEKNLVSNKPSLITIVSYSESRFLEFLHGFENDITGLSEIYMDIVKRVC